MGAARFTVVTEVSVHLCLRVVRGEYLMTKVSNMLANVPQHLDDITVFGHR